MTFLQPRMAKARWGLVKMGMRRAVKTAGEIGLAATAE